jgi:hypothetical protein
VLWSAIQTTRFNVKPKFGCDSDLVTKRRERFSNKLFVCIGAVDFGGVEERDAFFKGVRMT